MTMFRKTAVASVLGAIIFASSAAPAAGVNRGGINALRTGGPVITNGASMGGASFTRTADPNADQTPNSRVVPDLKGRKASESTVVRDTSEGCRWCQARK